MILHVKNLKKYFPIRKGVLKRHVGDVFAVDDVSFSVAEKEIVALVGESGSGKSTAALTAIRLLEPTAGEITFLGSNLATMSKKQLLTFRQNIGVVFQDPSSSLSPRKTILDNVGEALLVHGKVKNTSVQKEEVLHILESVGLNPEALYKYPHEFSLGQQQRIAIGRAIALKPKLLVCDEAVSALDVSIQAQILNLLYELKERLSLSLLFISHDLSVVRMISDRVLVMYKGKIVEAKPTNELFENPEHPYTKKLLNSIPCSHPRERKSVVTALGLSLKAQSPDRDRRD